MCVRDGLFHTRSKKKLYHSAHLVQVGSILTLFEYSPLEMAQQLSVLVVQELHNDKQYRDIVFCCIIIAISILTAFKCSIHSTSIGILNSISVQCFHTTGVVGVRIQVVEDKVVHTAISSLKHGG